MEGPLRYVASPLVWLPVAFAAAAWFTIKYLKPKKRIAGVVSDLYVYPIKSCHGIACNKVKFLSQGFKYDRRWVVIDKKNSIVNQKQKPTMTLIKTSIRLGRNGDEDETVVSVNAPGMFELTLRPLPKKELTDENLRIFANKKVGYDCGPEAGEWFSKFLEIEGLRVCYLIKRGEANVKRELPDSMFVKALDKPAPCLVITEASMDNLNRKLNDNLSIIRFRPNLIVKNTDPKPHEEDTWETFDVGTVTFEKARKCGRCIMTKIDPDTGIVTGAEPLAKLKTYRQEPGGKEIWFGAYVNVTQEGVASIGDQIIVSDK